jgi:alpha-beta hydrolase superfamily lysophospholipase
MRRTLYIAIVILALIPALAGFVGNSVGPGILHPQHLNSERGQQVQEMLRRTNTIPEDLVVRTKDNIELRGWKIRAAKPNGDWVLLFHGVADNRTGVLGAAELLLRHDFSVVMMDSRAHGTSGGDMATYGWKERYDTVAITDALYASENKEIRHLFALGVSMGAAIALQSAAIEPRFEGVVAEDPFADLREVTYDYAGLRTSPLLGKTLFRPAAIMALHSMSKAGGFAPDGISPEKAVAARPFAVLLICGTRDDTIPCRHTERIYQAATGPRELWVVPGALHASALGQEPAEYEKRVVTFFENIQANHGRK